MRKKRLLQMIPILFIILVISVNFTVMQKSFSDDSKTLSNQVILGIENFIQNQSSLVKNEHVGLLTNPSGTNRQLQSTIDLLIKNSDIHLTAIFGPEHGIRGSVYAGETVADAKDEKTGLPVFSLYGEKIKPNAEMLKDIDVILVDIQDIGLRAYTYIFTMAKVMEAAAESDKTVIILDRPNPVNGIDVEGNLVEEKYFSFVGLYPIPYRHGMTIGELAKLFNSEFGINCNLVVVPMIGWKREMYWGETRLSWVPTSPHVPHWETILPMISTGPIGELNMLSVGVGYTSPFELVGAPWINADIFSQKLNDLKLPGVIFRPIFFSPFYSLFAGENCQGIQIHITNMHEFKPYKTGFHIIQTYQVLYGGKKNIFKNTNRMTSFLKVIGSEQIVNQLKQNIPVSEIEKSWQNELNNFLMIRDKYLIY